MRSALAGALFLFPFTINLAATASAEEEPVVVGSEKQSCSSS